MPFTGIKYEKIAFCSSVSSTSGIFCFSSFPRSTGVSTCGICTVFPFQEERSVFLLTKANSSSLSCASVGFCGRSSIGTSSKSFSLLYLILSLFPFLLHHDSHLSFCHLLSHRMSLLPVSVRQLPSFFSAGNVPFF